MINNMFLATNGCAVDNGGCSHGCERTVISHFCTCPPGYSLANDSRHCVGMAFFSVSCGLTADMLHENWMTHGPALDCS